MTRRIRSNERRARTSLVFVARRMEFGSCTFTWKHLESFVFNPQLTNKWTKKQPLPTIAQLPFYIFSSAKDFHCPGTLNIRYLIFMMQPVISFKEYIVIFPNLFPTHGLWPLTSCVLQELVKEMVDMDIELMKKNPNAWDQKPKFWRHSWVQSPRPGGGPTFAFYDFLSLPFLRRGFVFLGLLDVKKKRRKKWRWFKFFFVLFYLEY